MRTFRPKTRLAGLGWVGLMVLALGSAYWPAVHAQSPEPSGSELAFGVADHDNDKPFAVSDVEFPASSDVKFPVPAGENREVPNFNFNLKALKPAFPQPETQPWRAGKT
ncbi:MAG: hypothetical protein R3B47_04690 [Bacteroidia bacterium]